MSAKEQIYNLVKQIPKGKVTTYGELAKHFGIKNPRIVGRLLHKNPDPKTIPCHRVVNYKGALAKNFAFGGADAQRKRLEAEGVAFKLNKVVLSDHRYSG